MDKERSCATCAHETGIGQPVKAPCAGCIVCGECTKWKAKQSTNQQYDTGKPAGGMPAVPA